MLEKITNMFQGEKDWTEQDVENIRKRIELTADEKVAEAKKLGIPEAEMRRALSEAAGGDVELGGVHHIEMEGGIENDDNDERRAA